MKRWICRFLLAAFVLSPIGCAARSRIASAVVSERNGQPCFAPSEPAALRTLQAVMVSDMSTVPAATIWEVTIDAARKAELAAGCVTYGQQFMTPLKTDESALPLRPGRVYKVFLNAPGADSRDPTYGYAAEFCLIEQPGTAKAGIHQIAWDKKLGRWAYEVCGIQK